MKSLILIDSKNSIFRHQHVHNFLSTEEGFPTGAVFGCLNSMLSLHKRLPEAGIVWVWDGKGETWRHKFMSELPQLDSKDFPEVNVEDYPDRMIQDSLSYLGLDKPPVIKEVKETKEKKRGYKAQRHRPELEKKKKKLKYPETPRERGLLQIPLLQTILRGCGIRQFEVNGLECDDLLGMLVKRIMELDNNCKIYVHSGDRDYYQLLKYKNVQIITNFKEGKLQKVKRDDVYKEFGVKPRHWAKFRALTGDSSDNIPHLANIGRVRAKQMLEDRLDPSKKFEDIPQEAKDKYGKFFPHGMETMWSALNGNYKLCKLVMYPDDDCLNKDVKNELKGIFDRLDSLKRFYRSSSKKTPEAFRRVSLVLAKYEMASIIARREELFNIP